MICHSNHRELQLQRAIRKQKHFLFSRTPLLLHVEDDLPKWHFFLGRGPFSMRQISWVQQLAVCRQHAQLCLGYITIFPSEARESDSPSWVTRAYHSRYSCVVISQIQFYPLIGDIVQKNHISPIYPQYMPKF